ncbi:Hypothetical protein HVR_LOCUS174 [uncultured virus]|nr:Hypothetical protein HVR_LOCUS174 [uncultured virus]
MEYYKEYSIRCKTTNDQIACFAPTYEGLLASGLSEEEALNELGITTWCCRIAMLNPTIVMFNMENREVIEGFKSVEAADEPDPYNENNSRPVFSSCLGTVQTPQIQTIKPLITPSMFPGVVQAPGRVIPNAPGTLPITIQPGIQTIGLLQAAPRVQATVATQTTVIPGIQPPILPQPIILPTSPEAQAILSPTLVAPIIPGIELGIDVGELRGELGTGIPVQAPETKKFQEPTLVGFPTINTDPTQQRTTIRVGANKQTVVLNGRTYLAR